MFGDIQQVLDSRLAAKSAVLTVRLDQWLLDASDRNLPHTRVSGATVADGASQTVAMPELGDGATAITMLPDRHRQGFVSKAG